MSKEYTIDVTDNISVAIPDGKETRNVTITSFALKAQSFTSYLDAVREARKSSGQQSVAMFREWVLRHVEARDTSGKPVTFTMSDLLMFPAKYAVRFSAWKSEDDSPEGSVITDGDGMSSPCLYKLGTPIPIGAADDAKVTELEFLAKTIGDIETVITADLRFEQVEALIRNCATPIGENVKLMRLTEFAMSQITVVDGSVIAQKVLPRFLS